MFAFGVEAVKTTPHIVRQIVGDRSRSLALRLMTGLSPEYRTLQSEQMAALRSEV